tara:strand:- start:53 stop:196 length:144 start_codon:yes stop_codon:yes gene_type:complete
LSRYELPELVQNAVNAPKATRKRVFSKGKGLTMGGSWYKEYNNSSKV